MRIPTALPDFPPPFLDGLLSRLPKLPFTHPPKLTFQDVVMGDPASKQYSLEANALLQPQQFTPGRGVVEASFVLGNNDVRPVAPYAYVVMFARRNGQNVNGADGASGQVIGPRTQVGTIPAHTLSSRTTVQASLPISVVNALQNGDVIQATLHASVDDSSQNEIALGTSDTYQWTVGGVLPPPVTPGLQGVQVTISSVEGPGGAVRDVRFRVTRER